MVAVRCTSQRSRRPGGTCATARDRVCVLRECPQAENKQKREYTRYWLFEAAYAGCLPCVSRFLEQEGVDPAVLSLSQGYSALDFALWGLSQGIPQAGAVASYLLAHYPHMPCQDTQSGRGRPTKYPVVDSAEVVEGVDPTAVSLSPVFARTSL